MPADGSVPGSPRAARLATPSWLDTRLVLGVLLVLVSVVVGARVLSSADRTDLVWAAATDVAPGAVLRDEDLVPQEVRLQGSRARYLDATQPAPRGYVVQRGLLAGELVPERALKRPEEAEYRQVTVNVPSGHAPDDLAVGDLVDVYVTPSRDGVAAAPVVPPQPGSGEEAAEEPAAAQQAPADPLAARRVLQRTAVAGVPAAGGFGGSADVRAVVLNVLPADVLAVVRASAEGTIDLVRLPVEGVARRDAVQAAG